MNEHEEEAVILVDTNDEAVGLMSKMKAHRLGRLHRAVSCFLFSKRGDLLIQQRAKTKYHSSGLWANTCCSHPRDGETASACMERRLNEELGIIVPIIEFATTRYRREVGDGLVEHEYVHGFVGLFDGDPIINREEVQRCRWIAPTMLSEIPNLEMATWFDEYIASGFLAKAIAAQQLSDPGI
jgi:isopentenyl-diphosphate Delta-isomerase